MNIDLVKKFVAENKYTVMPGTEMESRCIDGRYHSPSYLAPLARPGADPGEIFTILAALREMKSILSPEIIIEIVIRTVGSEKKFNFHTDEHHKNDFFGCGHLRLINQHFAKYGLSYSDVEYVLNDLISLERKGAHIDVLIGGHNEQMILEVISRNFSLRNILMANSEMVQAFVYHKTFDEERREKIIKSLMPYLTDKVKEEDLRKNYKAMAKKHLLTTISYLASGLPVYEVYIDENGESDVKEKVEKEVLQDYI